MEAMKSRKRNIYISKEKGNVKHFDSLVKFYKKKKKKCNFVALTFMKTTSKFHGGQS